MKSIFVCFLVLIFSCPFLGFTQKSVSTNVLYATDSSEITAEEKSKLISFLKNLDTVKIVKISVEAFCDDVGKNNYNDNLSNQRAEKVCDFLKKTISSKTVPIEAVGKGALQLKMVGNKNVEKQRAWNRRSEITIFYEKIARKTKTSGQDFSKFDTLKVGDKLTLENILFVGGRHDFLPESFPVLDTLVKILNVHKSYSIMILGHVCCSSHGEDGQDFETGQNNLSETRAKAVYDYLISKRISPKRLFYKGLKGAFPLGKGDKFDRRVEIQVTGKAKR